MPVQTCKLKACVYTVAAGEIKPEPGAVSLLLPSFYHLAGDRTSLNLQLAKPRRSGLQKQQLHESVLNSKEILPNVIVTR